MVEMKVFQRRVLAGVVGRFELKVSPLISPRQGT